MKNKKEVFLTKEGLEELAAELDNLKQVVRPEVISQIKEARAQGDLSENAEYHSARDRQGHVEARIKELEYLIDNATIIEETTKSDVVAVGSKVKIKYIDDDEEEEYSIVGSTEADPFENKISNESPIAKVIMGKKKGETVTVESPNGNYDIKIVSIN
ncbi:MAG: transcription elongation factor GreA [Bacilli bacterium]|nr:transcription elongation factor GreA [Bacilli bacterium]